MDWLRILLARVGSLFGHRNLDAELDAEVAAHVEIAREEYMSCGFDPEQAHLLAVRDFGSMTQAKENYRMQRGIPLLEELVGDVRFGVRQLIKQPAFTLTAVFTLALGIGANSAVFSVLNAVLVKPLPFSNPSRLVTIFSVVRHQLIGPSPLDARDFARSNHTFEKLAVFDQWRKNVITAKAGDNPEQVHVGLGPLELFQVLGVQPIIGRLFTPDEGTVGRNHVALLTEPFWESHYARDPGILGHALTINGLSYQIIGVIPGTIPGWMRGISSPIEVWEPLLPSPGIWDESQRGGRNYAAVGLLKPGVTLGQAEADLKTVADNLAATYPVDHGVSVAVKPLVTLRAGELKPQLYLLMGAVTVILLIACSNVAALLLARNNARQREFAMRAVLGARRTRLIRQILVETLLVAMLGGASGAALAVSIDRIIQSKHPPALSQLDGISVDWRVMLFTFLTAVCTSLLFGLAPAVLNSRISFANALKDGMRGSSASLRQGFRKGLVIGQIALSLMLTVSAALLVQTIYRLVHQNMGFHADHLLKAHFYLPDQFYPTAEAKTRFCDAFADRMRGLPEIHDVSISAIYPPYERWIVMFTVEGHSVFRTEDVPTTFFGVTDAAFLKTVSIPLLRGRDFAPTDREDTPAVAIVNQTFANRYLAGDNPIGKRIDLGSPANSLVKDAWMQGQVLPVTVIGMMADSKNDGLSSPVAPQLITLFRQMPVVNFGFKEVIVRSNLDPVVLKRTLVEQFHAVDSRLPLSEIETLDEVIDDATTNQRFTSLILTGFATLGLLLAVVGIYGVISYLVMQRNQELGIRLALGAGRSHVLLLIVRQGFLLALGGVCIGLAGTALVGRSLKALLYETSALDTLTLVIASALLLAIAIAASAIPARRATRIDPIKILRSE